jgi:ribosome-binding protein aMBF1 (putative translation factor)
MNLGKAIQQARKARGWTQKQLAQKVGLHRVTIADIEGSLTQGHHSGDKIAEALGIKLSELYAQAEELE